MAAYCAAAPLPLADQLPLTRLQSALVLLSCIGSARILPFTFHFGDSDESLYRVSDRKRNRKSGEATRTGTVLTVLSADALQLILIALVIIQLLDLPKRKQNRAVSNSSAWIASVRCHRVVVFANFVRINHIHYRNPYPQLKTSHHWSPLRVISFCRVGRVTGHWVGYWVIGSDP